MSSQGNHYTEVDWDTESGASASMDKVSSMLQNILCTLAN